MKLLGIKIFSTNVLSNYDIVKESIETVRNKIFDYVELFARPDSYEDTHKKLAELLQGIKVIIHAPHSVQGMDTGNPEAFENNCRLLKSSQQFADLFNAEMIVLHAGANVGEKYLNETIRQFKLINDKRITVENLPVYCAATGVSLHGTSPAEIKQIKEETGCKFCFDICHAVCAANSAKRDIWTDLKAYKNLNPDMYHLCDNSWDNTCDEHRHYGDGNYDFSKILNEIIEDNKPITMETGQGVPKDISPWLDDAAYLKRLM